ncbi:MAG: PqqD family protein [Myxococcales bacterium]|nr:PqqD family protein [Myxococcales bacterium]
MQLDPQARFRVLGGEGVVILQKAAEVLVTNECGARILELLVEGRPVGQVVDIVCDEYEIDEKTANADIVQFVDELMNAGAIRRHSESP